MIISCPEVIQQRPCVMRKVEMWLSDSTQKSTTTAINFAINRCLTVPEWILRCKLRGGWSKTSGYAKALQIGSSAVKHVASLLHCNIEKQVIYWQALVTMELECGQQASCGVECW